MTALQFESGLLGMVEFFCVELKQGDVAPLVFMVAFLADILFNMMPVQAMPGEFILRNLLCGSFYTIPAVRSCRSVYGSPRIRFQIWHVS